MEARKGERVARKQSTREIITYLGVSTIFKLGTDTDANGVGHKIAGQCRLTMIPAAMSTYI